MTDIHNPDHPNYDRITQIALQRELIEIYKAIRELAEICKESNKQTLEMLEAIRVDLRKL